MVPCAETVTLPIEATETATWKMIYEFNGATIRTDIDVTEGVNIAIPASVLNENYQTVVRFYKADNTQFEDKCYRLNVMATIFTNPSSSGNANGTMSKEYTGNDTDTQVFSVLDGKRLLTIDISLQTLIRDEHFTQTGTSVTIDLPGMVFQGKVVLNYINE